MSTDDVFDEGYDAYWDGRDIAENPYGDNEPEEHESWEVGWRAARTHDYDESDG
jgi:ribosome modulation factor